MPTAGPFSTKGQGLDFLGPGCEQVSLATASSLQYQLQPVPGEAPGRLLVLWEGFACGRVQPVISLGTNTTRVSDLLPPGFVLPCEGPVRPQGEAVGQRPAACPPAAHTLRGFSCPGHPARPGFTSDTCCCGPGRTYHMKTQGAVAPAELPSLGGSEGPCLALRPRDGPEPDTREAQPAFAEWRTSASSPGVQSEDGREAESGWGPHQCQRRGCTPKAWCPVQDPSHSRPGPLW